MSLIRAGLANMFRLAVDVGPFHAISPFTGSDWISLSVCVGAIFPPATFSSLVALRARMGPASRLVSPSCRRPRRARGDKNVFRTRATPNVIPQVSRWHFGDGIRAFHRRCSSSIGIGCRSRPRPMATAMALRALGKRASIAARGFSSSCETEKAAKDGKPINLFSAINQALHIALDTDPRSVLDPFVSYFLFRCRLIINRVGSLFWYVKDAISEPT
ncbi:hypothetical protein B296_00026024 [Ensete ventricosum]|uniref:Uncharacterized protein n=1 Tax=Ensete ventricosum TaxID=4639 RepID=A0A427AS69_ENSVE|nr:hypothetical protein B296_00026024 [Ensete ventricosum]